MVETAADRAILKVGGRQHVGFAELAVTRRLDAVTGSFDLTLAARGRAIEPLFPVSAGDRCELLLDGDTVIDGWIDTVAPIIGKDNHQLRVTGRDRSADLADCSALNSPASWRNQTIERIAADLAAPFGLMIDARVSTGAPIRDFALQQGESAQDAIERLLRFRGLLLVAGADGRLSIVKADEGAPVATMRYGTNILSVEALEDHRDRFSEYLVKGQARGNDQHNGKAVSQVRGRATDGTIRRHRPLLIVAEEQVDSASAEARAKFEAGVRAGRSHTCDVTVQGWRQPSGALWEPNRRVRLQCAAAGFDDTVLLIEGVAYRKGGDGTTTVLSLCPAEAWRQLADPGALK